jgi:hypothetical protein
MYYLEFYVFNAAPHFARLWTSCSKLATHGDQLAPAKPVTP